MGLLDGFPNGWLGLLRDPAQNPNENGGVGADAAKFVPPLFAPQPQRLPLSFAGPSLATDFANWPPAQVPAGNLSGTFPDAARPTPSVQSSPYQSIGQPPPSTRNLTAHALRSKGVSEPDITTAIGNPELMQQLINQHFGHAATGFAAKTENETDSNRYAVIGNNRPIVRDPPPSADGGPLGFGAIHRVEPSNLPYENNAVQLAQAFPPASLFARPPIIPRQLTPLEELPSGSGGGAKAGKVFPRWFTKQLPEKQPCTYCGRPTATEPGPDQLNGDHVIPRAKGGNSSWDNFAPACRTCNLEKGPRTPEQWYNWIQRGGA